MPIKSIFAHKMFDSHSKATIEFDLTTELGLFHAAVPSGASTGVQEKLGDDDNNCYHGKSVLQAVTHVNNTLTPAHQGPFGSYRTRSHG